MIRLAALLAALFGVPAAPVSAQPVASDADCTFYADQVAFAADLRDRGHPASDAAPGLSQSGVDEGMAAFILGWVFETPQTPPADLAASFLHQCAAGFD